MIESKTAQGSQADQKSDWQDYVAPVTAMALTLFFLVISYQLSEKARMVPLLALYSNLVLVSLELVGRSQSGFGRTVRRVLLGNAPPMKILGGYRGKPLSRELGAIGMILGFCGAVQLLGILPTVPFFVVLYMRLWSKMTLRTALTAAAIITVFVGVLFELILGVTLYQGLLFTS